jgi:hypothetical protein
VESSELKLNWLDKPKNEKITIPEIETVMIELIIKMKNNFLLIVMDKNFISTLLIVVMTG